MIPIVAPIMTSSDTTTPATVAAVSLLLVFSSPEAVGTLGVAVTDGSGPVVSKVSVLKLALVKGPVPTELKAATAISYRVEGFNPVISMFLMVTVSCL